MAWSIRNYNAFIRAARKESDLTLGQARNVYREMSQHLGRKLQGVDVAKHPRIFKKSERVATGALSNLNRVAPGGKPKLRGVKGSSGGKQLRTLRDFSEWADGMDFDSGYDEYESSADYGEV